MATFNDIVEKIKSSVSVKGSSNLREFFNDVGVMLEGVDLTTDQICNLIKLLHRINEKIESVFSKEILENFIENSLFLEISKIPEGDFDKVVLTVKDTFGDDGFMSLMGINFDYMGSFRLAVLIFINSQNMFNSSCWVYRLEKTWGMFEDSDRGKLLLLFDHTPKTCFLYDLE